MWRRGEVEFFGRFLLLLLLFLDLTKFIACHMQLPQIILVLGRRVDMAKASTNLVHRFDTHCNLAKNSFGANSLTGAEQLLLHRLLSSALRCSAALQLASQLNGYVMLPNLANFGHEPPLEDTAPACVPCLGKCLQVGQKCGESVQPKLVVEQVEQVETRRVCSSFYANFVAFQCVKCGRVSSLAEGAKEEVIALTKCKRFWVCRKWNQFRHG